MHTTTQKPFYEKPWFWYLLFAVLCYFLVFHKLGYHAIYTWDESLFATRAFYWAFHGEYFTNWSDIDFSTLDHPNTKPPFISIIQAFFLKLFAYHRFGLRFPIAVMGLASACIIIRLFAEKFNEFRTGLLAATILLSCYGFNQPHLLKSGDQDVALAFLLLVSLVFYWRYWHVSTNKNLSLVLFFVATGLAVITKSIMGFFMLPPVFLYTLFCTNWLLLLKNKWLYLGMAIMVLIIAGFYGVLETTNKGFLQLVWDNEIGGRYGKAIDNHVEPWYHYLNLLFSRSFMPWTIFALLGVFYGLRSKAEGLRNLVILFFISIVVFVATLSMASTKLYWYLAPVYPLASVLAAFGMVQFIEKVLFVLVNKKFPKWKLAYFTTIVCILAMVYPLFFMVKQTANNNTRYVMERYEIALEKIRAEKPEIKNIRIHTRNEWYPNLVYIANVYSKVYGYKIDIINSNFELNKGDFVFGEFHPSMAKYELEKIATFNDIMLYKVVGGSEH